MSGEPVLAYDEAVAMFERTYGPGWQSALAWMNVLPLFASKPLPDVTAGLQRVLSRNPGGDE